MRGMVHLTFSFFYRLNVEKRKPLHLIAVITYKRMKVGTTDWASSGYFDGSISDLRIYNRALNTAEIARLARIY